MGKVKNLLGQTFGRLTVLTLARIEKRAIWACSCSCGKIVEVTGNSLCSGNTSSCGCLHTEQLVSRNMADAKGVKNHPLYLTWTSMLMRCGNPNDAYYSIYGGRGIKVCDRWKSFETFCADVGDRPQDMTLDRIDTNGDYSPENVRWATAETQARNRRTNRMIEFAGRRLCVTEWALETGINKAVIAQRLNRGWAISDALTIRPDRRNRCRPNQ